MIVVEPDAARFPGGFPPPCASAWGDDEFGLYADVSIPPAPWVQRFRWIEPGTFLMGAPDGEPERGDDEGPQHLVTLTRGFWLADTTCSQAVWESVMGENPSRFSGDPQRPVERVSWTRVQEFLLVLGQGLPGCKVGLPTEAEWEYACRAGTTTAFSFGEDVRLAEVNYDRNGPEADRGNGDNRDTTVPVKSLAPNPWGLYEMHGNVWEWCADRQRKYRSQAEVDPAGAADDSGGARAHRAMRGGSYHDLAGRARSAYRGAGLPGDAYGALGFRVCLRSTSTELEANLGSPRRTASKGSAPLLDGAGHI